MLVWKSQGAAFAADLALIDGRRATAVIVADRQNPRGLVLLLQEGGAAPTPVLIEEVEDALAPGDHIELLTMQERAFGAAGLPRPELRP